MPILERQELKCGDPHRELIDRASQISNGKYKIELLPNPKYQRPWAVRKTSNYKIVYRSSSSTRCLKWVESVLNPKSTPRQRVNSASKGRLFVARRKGRWVAIDRISGAIVGEARTQKILAERIEQDFKDIH